jgi:protein SCO1
VRFTIPIRNIASVGVLLLAAVAQKPVSMDDGRQTNTRPPVLEQVGIDQHVGQTVPLDLAFTDEHGREVRLADYFHRGRPVLLALVYFDCPMLCNQVLNGTTSALGVLQFTAGKEFDVVAVSFDPRETPELAAAKKKTYLDRYKRPGAEAGWHFLTGKQPSIDALTRAVGFRYMWDEKTSQFAHASGLMLLTPEGRLAQYYYGIEYAPRDLRFGIMEAAQERLGTIVDQLLLYCYHYDPTTGKYGLITMRVLRLTSALTVLVLGTFMFVSFRRDKRNARSLREV